jgi:hypothetical protein
MSITLPYSPQLFLVPFHGDFDIPKRAYVGFT